MIIDFNIVDNSKHLQNKRNESLRPIQFNSLIPKVICVKNIVYRTSNEKYGIGNFSDFRLSIIPN